MKTIIAKIALAALVTATVAPVHAGTLDDTTKQKIAAGLALLACVSFGYANEYKKPLEPYTPPYAEHYRTENNPLWKLFGMGVVSIVGLLALLNPEKN